MNYCLVNFWVPPRVKGFATIITLKCFLCNILGAQFVCVMVIEVKLSFDSLRTLKQTYGIKSESICTWYWCALEQFCVLIWYVYKVKKSFVSISTFKTHIALNQNELLPGLPNIWHHGKNIVRSQRTAQSTSHPLMRCQASGSWQTLDILYWKKIQLWVMWNGIHTDFFLTSMKEMGSRIAHTIWNKIWIIYFLPKL